MIEVQTTLVASPRNHLYRTGHSLIEFGPLCFGFNAKLDHFCLAEAVKAFTRCPAANRTAELPNGEFDASSAPVVSKLRSLWPLAPTLTWLTRGYPAIFPVGKISLEKQRTSGRRGWDSNPRYGYPYNGFRVLRFSCWPVPFSS